MDLAKLEWDMWSLTADIAGFFLLYGDRTLVNIRTHPFRKMSITSAINTQTA